MRDLISKPNDTFVIWDSPFRLWMFSENNRVMAAFCTTCIQGLSLARDLTIILEVREFHKFKMVSIELPSKLRCGVTMICGVPIRSISGFLIIPVFRTTSQMHITLSLMFYPALATRVQQTWLYPSNTEYILQYTDLHTCWQYPSNHGWRIIWNT